MSKTLIQGIYGGSCSRKKNVIKLLMDICVLPRQNQVNMDVKWDADTSSSYMTVLYKGNFIHTLRMISQNGEYMTYRFSEISSTMISFTFQYVIYMIRARERNIAFQLIKLI